MTHDELLKDINEYVRQCEEGIRMEGEQGYKALRAVVELHKPIDNPNFPDSDRWCWQCAEGRGYAKYPCPTIQAIEKELG